MKEYITEYQRDGIDLVESDWAEAVEVGLGERENWIGRVLNPEFDGLLCHYVMSGDTIVIKIDYPGKLQNFQIIEARIRRVIWNKKKEKVK